MSSVVHWKGFRKKSLTFVDFFPERDLAMYKWVPTEATPLHLTCVWVCVGVSVCVFVCAYRSHSTLPHAIKQHPLHTTIRRMHNKTHFSFERKKKNDARS